MRLGVNRTFRRKRFFAAASLIPPERLIANYCRPLTSLSGTNRQVMSRTAHDAWDDISSLKIVLANFRLTSGTPNEQALGSSMTVTASVEYPAGTFKQITFGGNAQGTINSGDLIFSDYTAGDLAIPSGATFWIRLWTVSAGSGTLFNSFRNSARGDIMNTAVSGLSDQTMGGTISSVGNFSRPPLMIIGRTNKAAPLLWGDSKCAGNNDASESLSAAGPGIQGNIAKSLPTSQPFLNVSTGSLRAGGGSNDWTTVCVKRKLLLPYFSHVFFALGYNDVLVDGATAATTKTRVENCISDILLANPTAKITLITLGPKSTSVTGGWTSIADQGAQGNTERTAFNTYVRNGSIAGNNNGYFEIANNIDDGPGNGKWPMHPTRTRTLTDAAITTGTATLTSATAAFTSADIGVGVTIIGAGVAGGNRVSVINSITNSTTAVIRDNAATTVSGATCHIGATTTDGLHETPNGYDRQVLAGSVDYATKLAA